MPHTQVQPRNEEKLTELVGYLEKHRTEIIDYERRKQAGKSIGSGRVEKGVDQVIGHRQKEKGSSWRPKGNKALAILKVLNPMVDGNRLGSLPRRNEYQWKIYSKK